MAYQRIFVALDENLEESTLFEKALEIAGNNGAIVRFGHVVNTGPVEASGTYPAEFLPQLKEDFDEKVAPYLERAKNDERIKEVQYVNEVGHIRETLLEREILPFEPDLVICGARGLSPIRYALLGSVSSFLVKHVACDVLVIK